MEQLKEIQLLRQKRYITITREHKLKEFLDTSKQRIQKKKAKIISDFVHNIFDKYIFYPHDQIEGIYRYRTTLMFGFNLRDRDEVNDMRSAMLVSSNQTDIDVEQLYINYYGFETIIDILYICFDIRWLIKNRRDETIEVNNKFYYLSKHQLAEINKIWSDVNPSMSSGVRYKQNLEYMRAMRDDMSK